MRNAMILVAVAVAVAAAAPIVEVRARACTISADTPEADATRCMGPTGFLRAAALCGAHGLPLSAHTAPSLHVHTCCATDDTGGAGGLWPLFGFGYTLP